MLKQWLAMTAAGALTLFGGIQATAQEAFGSLQPVLQKITINGAVFYENGKTANPSITLKSDAPAKFEYTFVNTGEGPSKSNASVFVHFADAKEKIIIGGDFKPAKPTSQWAKDTPVTETRTINFAKGKGQTLTYYIGLYYPDAKGIRQNLVNAGKSSRLKLGSITVE